MKTFKLEGLDRPLELPDEYLNVEQWENCLRALLKTGKTDVDLADIPTLRMIAEAAFADKGVTFGSLPSTPHNTEQLLALYTHVAELMAKSMTFGDPVIDEVENAKKDQRVTPAPRKKRTKSKQV